MLVCSAMKRPVYLWSSTASLNSLVLEELSKDAVCGT